MKVWIVDPSNFTPYYDYALCRALNQSGCEASIVTSAFAYEQLPFATDTHFDYRFFRFAGSLAGAGARRFAKAVEYPIDLALLARRFSGCRPDVVHFQWLLSPALDLSLARWLRRRGCRTVITIHNVRPHDRQPYGQTFFHRIASAFDVLIVHSAGDQDFLRENVADLSPTIEVIPHGILFEDHARTDRADARAKLGLPPGARIILFFGLVERYKGADVLAAAMPEISRHLPGSKLIIAGKPASGYARLAEQLARADVSAHVILRPDFIPSDRVSDFFSAADLVVLPYLTATQSGVLMASYHFGVPVVVTDTGGVAETVAGDRTGLVVPPGDAQALAEAVVRMLSDESLAANAAERMREMCRGRYSWPVIARQTMDAYRNAGKAL